MEQEDLFKQPSTEYPRRKLLLTHPNPNQQTSFTESPESTISSNSSPDRLERKTRDLPNLSDCHSCGVRVNFTNPRDRLQPLDSMWRIVLLCKKCSYRINSSGLCSYCFDGIVDKNDCFRCCECQHSVHKECVGRYGSGLGFTVCVDCWVPDGIAKSIKARARKFKERGSVGEMRRKVVLAVKARDFEIKKGKDFGLKKGKDFGLKKVKEFGLKKDAVALGKGGLSVVAGKKVIERGEVKGGGDVELAFLLHRAINSSPRISRYGCSVGSCRKGDVPIVYSRRGVGKKIELMGSGSLDVPIICYSRRDRKGLLRKSASLSAPLVCYSRRRIGWKVCSRDVEYECGICKESNDGSTLSVGLKDCDSGSSLEHSLSGNSSQENDVERKTLLKYYRVGKGKQRPSAFAEDSGCCSCMDSDLFTKGMADTRNYGNGNKCVEVSENCDDDTDRFLLKYKRSLRHKVTEPEFSCKVEEFS